MVLNLIPFLFFCLSVSNIVYLSLISLFHGALLSSTLVILTRLGCLAITYLFASKYRLYFETKTAKYTWIVMIPYLVIMMIRLPLVYPTYDDLAAHIMWGDYANNLWNIKGFMPMNFLNYFYLPLDMNYTLFLNLIGLRATIWLFYTIVSIWFVSLYSRFIALTTSKLKQTLLTGLFVIIPFIPHLVAVIGTLMGDYASLIFCLEALYLFLRKGKDKTFALIMMITAILMKQSNSVFIAPVLLYYSVINRKAIKWSYPILYMLWAAIFFVRLYLETGNPLSGLFNGVFQSSLYGLSSFRQTLFGPESWWQTLIWPITGQFSERYAEGIVSTPAKIFYSFMPIVAYLSSIFLMIKKRSWKYALLVLTYLLWSHLVGYARYYIALNLMSLIVLIFEIPSRMDKYFKLKPSQLPWLFLGFMLLAMTSFKTDFSWRPNPSLATPGANRYYLGEYFTGLSLLTKDTLPKMAKEYRDVFAPYQAVFSLYRGPVTYVAYMGHLQGLPVYDGISIDQHQQIMADEKISPEIKNQLKESMDYARVILLVDESSAKYVHSLELFNRYRCSLIGPAKRDRYLQRESYFTGTLMYDCEQP